MDDPTGPEDRSGVRAICTISVIAGRKIDFVNVALHELAGDTDPALSGSFGARNLARTKIRLTDTVAGLDWRLFVTASEMENRRLKLTTTLDDLDRRAIWSEIANRLDESP
jgi:hypothetical protein